MSFCSAETTHSTSREAFLEKIHEGSAQKLWKTEKMPYRVVEPFWYPGSPGF